MYFFLYYTSTIRENQSDVEFTEPQNRNQTPECIYLEEAESKNKRYCYYKIFKCKPSENSQNYKFAFIIGEDKYEISFDSQGSKFIYDVNLEYGLKIIKVRKKIPQNKIEYKDKLDFFKKALEQNREEEKIDDLYKDTINLYSKKKGFNFLIPLFFKIYQKKELCQKLLKEFKETEEKTKPNNMDRKADLKDYTSQFGEIILEAEKLIKLHEYDPIQFYGIILCYTNFYHQEKFYELVDELSNKKPEDLYEIMLVYSNHFINPINKNFEFFNKFISYTIEKSNFSIFKIGLIYIKDLETFINVIEKNKVDIFEKFKEQINEKNIIKIDKSLKLKEDNKEERSIKEISNSSKVKNKNMDYIENFESIIKYSKEKNIIIIYFTKDFWKYIINCYKEPILNNIEMCSKLRKIFIDYKDLVESIYPQESKSPLRKDVIECFKNDEFSFLLDQIIRNYIKKQNLTSIEKLTLITDFNPYYKKGEYPKKVDPNIFNLINLDDVDGDFINYFKNLKFEYIFMLKLADYIKTITSKIKKISNFNTVIKLINIENLKDIENKYILIYLEYLKKKYDIIKKEVEDDLQALSGKKLEEAAKIVDPKILKTQKLNETVKVIVNLAFINFAYEKEEKKFDFIKNIINELPKNIIPLIFNEIINKCVINEEKKDDEIDDDGDSDEEEIDFAKDIDFKKMMKYIFEIIADEVKDDNDINNIIELIDCIKGTLNIENDKLNNDNYDNFKKQKENLRDKVLNEFLDKLMDKNLFTKEEFFANKYNIKIALLYKLNERKIIKESEEDYYKDIIKLIESIKEEIEGNIKKQKLEEFLKNEDIEKRLGLINLIHENYNPDEVINNLKEKINKINEDIKILNVTKDNIILYYKCSYKDLIKELIKIIKDSEDQKINEYIEGGNLYDLIKKCEELKEKVKKIEKVKDFLLFNIIYEMNAGGKDEEANFTITMTELKSFGELINKKNIDNLYKEKSYIIDKIISKLKKNEKENKKFIDTLINYYEIKDESLIDDLTILFKSEKYKFDINSMIFFFECLKKEKEEWDNVEIIKRLEQNKDLSPKEFDKTKRKLLELNDEKMKIYDYKNIGEYNKLFTSLYDKKEAIDFLIDKIDKIDENIEDLKKKIDPTNTTIKTENILDTKICVQCIKDMKEKKDYKKILLYIKNLNKKIDNFVNYSKNYSQIIDLDRYYNPKENIYEEVEPIIKKDLTLNIFQDSENFFYLYENKKENKCEKISITMEKLINLKNKIPPRTENDEDDIKPKSKALIFFKDLITNLEKINEYMKALRTKGSSLPIKISIKVLEMYNIDYYLDGKKVELSYIENKFLSPAKNTYIAQLKSEYEKNPNIRLLYGKQFRSMMRHLEDGLNIDSFLRYIINNTDSTKINEGDKGTKRDVKDFVQHYEEYNEGSLQSISNYINSLFEKNGKTLEEHYEGMKIISENIYKGIYLQKCKKDCSMEKFIIELFLDKIDKLPIAQNVLITNKETSDEEMQSFFNRAILCNYNTLFVIEINDSISEYQQSIMNAYISQLLSKKYKNKKENNKGTEGNENATKKNTKSYVDSCVVFVYEEKNNKIKSFLKEINKLENQNFDNDVTLNNINSKKNNYQSKLDNIRVIISDICGLGKSGKIRKDIQDEKKKYFHFPLGGILTKDNIFNKLENLLNKIKNENYKDVAIHLDLTESKEKSVLNEFFFSFLITKFYTNNENILYIPKDISIFIEIPNCFESYLDQFSILNIFTKDKISFNNMPPINCPKKMNDILRRMLGKNSIDNEELKKFIEKYLGIKKYSYHQINIFINLFISQYSKFDGQLSFYEYELDDEGLTIKKDTTERCIEEFAKCAKYFTDGSFPKLLTGEFKSKKENYIDKLSEVYDNDLDNMKFSSPLIFIIKEKMKIDKLTIPTKNSKEYNSIDYLIRLKKLLNLPNEVEKDVEKNEVKYKSLLSIIEEENNNYVITNDNFKKMVLLIYRIYANVPVIIMGDTGCGKTALITKLNQILNNGEKTVKIENMHPGINDEKLCEIMKENDELAREQGNNKELWLFFDEINTCPSLSLITEIFINRTYYGNPISDNIRLIGACNPYRKRKKKKKKCGLSFSEDNDDELVYLVNPLPQSLLYYVFSFGRIDDDDEKKYIYSIIERLFPKEEKKKCTDSYSNMTMEQKENLKKEIKALDIEIKTIKRELKFHDITTEAISKCHKYLRKNFDDSVVSLREIVRFPKLVDFFKIYFREKNEYEGRNNNEKNNKIRSIICSIYLCYYIRLIDEFKRNNFEQDLRSTLLQLVTYEEIIPGNLKEQIQIEELKTEIEGRPKEKIEKNFSDFLKIEQDYLIKQIKPDKGIGKNSLLKENTFLLFVSVLTNIPLIIIGKPGTGKSLSVQLINKSLKGEYSIKKFFKIYPKIIQTYFQGSLSTNTADVENLFRKLGDKLIFYKKLKEKNPIIKLPISMACFDELGLAERSKNNPLKILHPELDYAGKKENESFVGISNYTLDAAKLNRALVLSVPDLDDKKDELIITARKIVKSIDPKIKDEIIFEILSNTYFQYKKLLKFIKELVVYRKYYKKYMKGKESKTQKRSSINNKEGEIKENEIKVVEDNNPQEYGNKENEEEISKTFTITSKNSQHDGNEKIEKIMKGTFETIKQSKEFIELMKKDDTIRKDFHGNRDFYNLIKGIANALRQSGDLGDNEKVAIIIKFIERNFGGIEYSIHIDFNLILDDIREEVESIKRILQEYTPDIKNEIKLNSVYLFKKLYNLQCQTLDKDGNLHIDENDIKKYNLNNCINDNISDINSRYLLLIVKQSLTPLIVENIKLENPLKDKIILYDGSPFPDDDNNDYKFKKISEIREDAKDDKLIIIENLEQIHPFLYDLYNMNYEIIDEDKYARICLDSFRELKTLVNEKFRIIILVDERFVNKCDLAFLNRLEKLILSSENLLDDDLKKKSENIINGINLKGDIEDFEKENANYSLKDILINCEDQDLQGLIYYYSNYYKKNENVGSKKKENIDENELKEKVIDKIYKILPQDIISILGKNNDIKKKYYASKNIYNFKGYLEEMKKEENKNYKISIIYTFTSIANIVEGLDNEMSFMISRIKSENEFKSLIEEKKKNNNNLQKKYIFIHFEQSNSKNIKFISNFILYNFKDDYKYIIIIHVNRNFNKVKDINKKSDKEKETIYSLPDINPNIDQIFIDNLNGNDNISLKDLLDENEKDIKNIIEKLKDEMKLDEEFNKALTNFLREELDKKGFEKKDIKEYIKEIQNYMDDEKEIKNKIIEKAYELNDNLDQDDNSSDIIENIHKKKKINSFTVDIVSCLIEYIKEEIFIKNLKNIFKILEDNNILTTIIEIQKRKYDLIDQSIVEEIVMKYLDEKTEEKSNIFECKFLYNFNSIMKK